MNAYSRRFRPTRGPNPQNSVWFRTAVKDRLLVEGDRQDMFRCAGTPRSPPCLSLGRHDWKTSRGDEEDATFRRPRLRRALRLVMLIIISFFARSRDAQYTNTGAT